MRGHRDNSETSLFITQKLRFPITWDKNETPSSNLRDEGAFFDSVFRREAYLALHVTRRGHFLEDTLKILFILELDLNLILTLHCLDAHVGPERAAQ